MSASPSSRAVQSPLDEVGRLRRRSLIALLVLLISASIGHLISRAALRRGEGDSQVINVAGRQRMLSQRVAKSMLAARSAPTEELRELRLGEARVSSDRWSRAHDDLRNGDPQIGFPAELDPEFQQALDEIRVELDEVLGFVDRQKDAPLTDGDVVRLILLESSFLEKMEEYVSRLERRADQRIAFAGGLETGFYLLSLVALIAQAMLVLRPAMARLERSIVQREESLAIRDSAESERAAVLEAVSDRAFTVDHEGWATSIGSSRSPRAHDLSRLLTPGSFERLRRAIGKQLESGGSPARLELVPSRRGSVRRFDARLARLAGNKVVLVVRDISELHRARAKVVSAIDAERDRFGKEIHDGLCQDLLGLLMELRRVGRALNRSEVTEREPESAAAFGEVLEAFERILDDARALGRAQIAPRLQRAGSLAEALRSLARTVTTDDGPTVRVEVGEAASQADPDEVDHHLFRIAQEAVQNALKHADAALITLRLATVSDGPRLQIEDDGCGPPTEAAARRGVGLTSMHLRAQLIGSELEIGGRDGGGTRISVVCG